MAVVGTDRGTRPDGWRGGWVAADLADTGAPGAIAGAMGAGLERVVLAAGVLDGTEWDAITPEAAMRVLQVNLVAPYFLLRELLPRLNDGAAVVVVGSIAGLRGSPATPFYAAARRGCAILPPRCRC